MHFFLTVVRSLFLLIVFAASLVGGGFAAVGVCYCIFGPSVFDTVLGDPPDRSHPAFYVFALVMIPGIFIGGIGALFGIVYPIAAYWRVLCVPGTPRERLLLRIYIDWISRLLSDEQQQ